MLFWIAAAGLTAFALAFVLWPVSRRARTSADEDDAVEVALYRSQIAAVEREAQAGRIASDEISATETELKRRMLAAARRRSASQPAEAALSKARTRIAFFAIGLGVPMIAAAVYLLVGHPGLPDRPFAERAAERVAAGLPSDQDVALTRELAARMAANPADPKGWALLGGAYVRQQRYDDAILAYENAVARRPGDADLLTALGEALVLRSGGEVIEAARARFEAALKLSPGHPQAAYFVGLAKAQAGDLDGAISDWTALLAGTPANAPWRASIEALIAEAQKQRTQAAAGPGPVLDRSIADTAATMSAEDRASMIGAMVERLSQRLAQSPNDLDGWLRLARSYVVLNEPVKARQALDQAAEHFAGDAAALEQITQARKQLGLSSG